jgi:serine protease Do
LVVQGTVKRAYLGMSLQSVEQDLARQFGVQTERGALVAEVMPGTPAAV